MYTCIGGGAGGKGRSVAQGDLIHFGDEKDVDVFDNACDIGDF